MRHRMLLSALVTIFLAALAGCAGRQAPASVAHLPGGGNMIAIEAGNYRFEPDEIQIEKPGEFILQVTNVSRLEHNLTLKDPHGKILKDITVGPKQTTISNIELDDPGLYEFYDNKPLRSPLGMKGKIVIGGPR